MRVVKFEVFRDDEAGVWWARSTTDHGIITEAETIEALRERLKLLVPDFLETDDELRIDLEVRVSDVVQAA
jgi:predicted RNase H-like HicB family nuclease